MLTIVTTMIRVFLRRLRLPPPLQSPFRTNPAKAFPSYQITTAGWQFYYSFFLLRITNLSMYVYGSVDITGEALINRMTTRAPLPPKLTNNPPAVRACQETVSRGIMHTTFNGVIMPRRIFLLTSCRRRQRNIRHRRD